MSVEKIVSVLEDKIFVPLNSFEKEEVCRLVALQFARNHVSELRDVYGDMEREILSKSARFVRVRSAYKGAALNQPDVFFEGYEESKKDMVYVVCNNCMKLYFNDKVELIARSN